MKSFRTFISFLCFYLITVTSFAQIMQHENFQEAMQSRLFSISKVGVNGLGEKNIYLDIESKSFDSVSLLFEPGLILLPANDNFQQLMLIEEQTIVFSPKEIMRIYLMGYCINPSKAGPREKANYKQWRMASSELKNLAVLMNNYPTQNSQRIIWDFIGRVDLNEINVYLKEGAEAQWNQFLTANRPNQNFKVATVPLKHKPYSPLKREMEVLTIEEEVASIATQLLFRNDSTLNLSLRVIDEEGAVVRQYFENKEYEAGAHSIVLGFSDFYPKETVFRVQLINNGELYKELEVKEDTPFEEREIYEVHFNYQFTVREELQNMKILLKTKEGELVSQLKEYDELEVAYHNLKITFNHYYDPNQSFLLELVGENGKVYDRTQFTAMRKGKKLYSEW